MTLAWMFYALIVSVCFALAAYAAEWVLRAFRQPGRWVWAVAIVGTALVPMMAFLPERSVESEATLLETPPAPMSQSVAAAFKWTASKKIPKKYGDKQQIEHTGKVGLIDLTDAELAKKLEDLENEDE